MSTGQREAVIADIPRDVALARVERWARVAFWGLLIVGWAAAVFYMWEALTTIPDAERLEQSRLVAIPTPRTFFAAAAFSAMELALVLAAIWPWRAEYYATRLALTTLVMVTWFISTTPMGLSRMDWVHRRWLAGTILALAAALALLLAYRLVRSTVASRDRDAAPR